MSKTSLLKPTVWIADCERELMETKERIAALEAQLAEAQSSTDSDYWALIRFVWNAYHRADHTIFHDINALYKALRKALTEPRESQPTAQPQIKEESIPSVSATWARVDKLVHRLSACEDDSALIWREINALWWTIRSVLMTQTTLVDPHKSIEVTVEALDKADERRRGREERE